MILKNIRLSNIRSYRSQDIGFPDGSFLLSGDIGAGKSSILLAAEFALFGIMRGDLAGENLLRHGAKEGSVELKFEVDGRDVTIKRKLKRQKDSVKQDSGHIIIDGKKIDGTHVELKTKILDLLGYPKELVSKSKSLVYRYTVYTPQEQMKHILFDDREERLNILRRVFGIDKYKRIAENTAIIARKMKEKTKELQGFISDLDEKRKSMEENMVEMEKAEAEIRKILPVLEDAKINLKKRKEIMEKYEKDIAELNRLKNSMAVSDEKLRERASATQRSTKELEILGQQIETLKKKKQEKTLLKKSDAENKKILLEKEKALEKEISRLRLEINELELKKKNSGGIKEKISKLSNCPTCLQDVPDGHKKTIIGREDRLSEKCMQEIKILREKLSESEEQRAEIRKSIDKIIENEKQFEKLKAELDSAEDMLTEKEERKVSLMKMQEEIKKEVAAINTEKIELNKKLTLLSNSEADYKKEKKIFDELMEKEKQAELEKTRFEERADGIKKVIVSFEKEIGEKEKKKAQLDKARQMQDWLEKQFLNVVGVIERNVMCKIHTQFRELFQQWFNVLVEDEALSINLDESFTPTVEQDGYEASVEGLSGGEKTAIALAYRLSLNKVINDIVGTIKTKDIIILDEPTDGFSSEQLDKVREVIDELNMKQVIIVSHEPKIESFVDNIIRIEKSGHVSSVTG